ncbi:hypothetical protein [Priestia filamentosa]|uniref:hypothetical protein n=1 Tax=Priestia filamentosa TaxID=1402861 RepID=UPI0039820790
MKNHKYINGKFIKMNKRFSTLTINQKELIQRDLKERYISRMIYPGLKLPAKKRDQLLDETYDIIENKDVWIFLENRNDIITARFLLLFVVIENSMRASADNLNFLFFL